ncbi:acyl-CoA dehydrogenase family protein [Microbacterium sp. CPCC 204701]|uniref:acyl-CoA dehydrogenase family protein n=1 Tax=Microbacterium sp. CPCC 204701 TaxID=2493084 RepID=UPI0013E2AEAB|nr:acyl-CoA dehydrogenase [Microbacterium sp. CPCC 204701]
MTETLFALDAAHERIREAARTLAAEVAPFAAEADDATEVHVPTAEALRRSGLAAYVVPREFGGHDDTLDPLALAIIREQLMAVSAHLDSLFGMQGVGSYALSVGGSDELRREWLPKVARAEAIPSIALTEPEVGSDLRGITTTIAQDGDVLRISGRKAFITNAGAADFACVLGKEGDGYSMALVPTDSPGLRVTSGPELIAPHIIGELHFDDVVVPAVNRLGEPGKAFALMLQTLAVFRVSVAGSAVGLAQAALDEAVRHATSREQFGKPLMALGSVSQNLALSWAEIEAARALTYRAAALAASDPLAHIAETSMAKVIATETSARVVDRAVQAMGRFGLIRGSVIERLYRNARPVRIYEGSTEVLLDSLARQLAKRTTS